MSLIPCSRRVPGHVRPRAVSVTTSGSHPFALRASSTLPCLDMLSQDLITTPICHEADVSTPSRDAPSDLTTYGGTSHSAISALGRLPPMRRLVQPHDADGEYAQYAPHEPLNRWPRATSHESRATSCRRVRPVCRRHSDAIANLMFGLPHHRAPPWTLLMFPSRKHRREHVPTSSFCRPPVASLCWPWAALKHH